MNDPRALLTRLPLLRRPCDLDLLVFFATHPRSLLSTEQLAQRLGETVTEIARSLNVLQAAGVLNRAHQPGRPARMYVFSTNATNEALPAVIAMASTRQGRLMLRTALSQAVATSVENDDEQASSSDPYTRRDG